MMLPAELTKAIGDWLLRHRETPVRRATEALSAAYRSGGTSASVDAGAYLVSRLPATFAAIAMTLSEIGARRPDFAPETLLDVGAGPGTASWAALAQWPGIASVAMVDRSAAMLELAGELAAESRWPVLANAGRMIGDVERLSGIEPKSLVVSAYTLAELPESAAASAARNLWNLTAGMLLIVEPGTPAGFSRIGHARDELLRLGAVPVAPCPHAAACPIAGKDWCHFSVRLPRRRAHMHAKAASVPFEDEKFSYIAVSRNGEPSGGARILSPPVKRKPGLTLRLCTAEGIETRPIARRDGQAYKQARHLGWGDFMPGPPQDK